MSITAVTTVLTDTRFPILQDATGGVLPNEVVQLCLSYLPLTSFSSVKKFLDYFKEKDVLYLSSVQPLAIYDLSSLCDIVRTDPPNFLFDHDMSGMQKISFYLDTILALIAKTMTLKGEEELQVSFKFSAECLFIQPHSDCIFETQKGSITVRPRDLFWMMEAYGVSELSFAPNQLLQFFDVLYWESQCETIPNANLKKWTRHVPPGCTLTWRLNLKEVAFESGTLEGRYGIHQSQRIFVISAPKGMTLLLEKRNNGYVRV